MNLEDFSKALTVLECTRDKHRMIVVRFIFLPGVAQDFIESLDEERRIAEMQYESSNAILETIEGLGHCLEEVSVWISGRVVAKNFLTGEVTDNRHEGLG